MLPNGRKTRAKHEREGGYFYIAGELSARVHSETALMLSHDLPDPCGERRAVTTVSTSYVIDAIGVSDGIAFIRGSRHQQLLCHAMPCHAMPANVRYDALRPET